MTTAAQVGVSTGTWRVDTSHSEVGFTVRHLMSKVRGKFDDFEATIQTQDDINNSRVSVSVDLSSINTGAQGRDDHLRSSDFFEVESHPTMTFTSTGVVVTGDDQYVLTGELAIKGVAKSIELDVEFLGEGADPWGGTRLGAEASGTISRKEFGIDFNVPIEGSERLMIGDKIGIEIQLEAVLHEG